MERWEIFICAFHTLSPASSRCPQGGTLIMCTGHVPRHVQTDLSGVTVPLPLLPGDQGVQAGAQGGGVGCESHSHACSHSSVDPIRRCEGALRWGWSHRRNPPSPLPPPHAPGSPVLVRPGLRYGAFLPASHLPGPGGHLECSHHVLCIPGRAGGDTVPHGQGCFPVAEQQLGLAKRCRQEEEEDGAYGEAG